MNRIKVGVVDYGIGNHGSVRSTFELLGCKCFVSSDVNELDHSDALVLPGVGAFASAIDAIDRNGLRTWLVDKVSDGIPFLGICLGMQLLLDKSFEDGLHNGLGIVSGEVVPFPDGRRHIGWNAVYQSTDIALPTDKIGTCYFNHSYQCIVPSSHTLLKSDFVDEVTVGFQIGNVFGYQFHPEKSQSTGKMLLNNFLNEVRSG